MMAGHKMLCYCPRCARISPEYPGSVCNLCKIQKVATELSGKDYEDMYPNAKGEYNSRLFHTVIETNPLFSQSAYEEQHRIILKELGITPHNPTQSGVLCPKCGSNQIQIVEKKWSFLTGFLTNKVDRVCVRCKHRF